MYISLGLPQNYTPALISQFSQLFYQEERSDEFASEKSTVGAPGEANYFKTGTDSGYEGITTHYFSEITVDLTPTELESIPGSRLFKLLELIA